MKTSIFDKNGQLIIEKNSINIGDIIKTFKSELLLVYHRHERIVSSKEIEVEIYFITLNPAPEQNPLSLMLEKNIDLLINSALYEIYLRLI